MLEILNCTKGTTRMRLKKVENRIVQFVRFQSFNELPSLCELDEVSTLRKFSNEISIIKVEVEDFENRKFFN